LLKKFDLDKPYNYPFDDNSFDSVILGETIEHVPDLTLLMNELKRILKPKGRLVISTPNPASPVEIIVHFMWYFTKRIDYKRGKQFDHVHEFLFSNMITLMNIHGFTPKSIEGAYIQLPFTKMQIICKFQPLAYQTIYLATLND
jgi:ubiquinone/menaquinone biosynthesis C-methylase UbiE